MTLEERYAHLKALAAAAPDFGSRFGGRITNPETFTWLGRLAAVLQTAGSTDAITVQLATDSLGTALHDFSQTQILAALYRGLAACELQLPSSARGAYISVGNAFDAIVALRDILGSIRERIIIVDAYMNSRVLSDFAPLAPEGVSIALLSDEATVKPDLKPACRAWNAQWANKRPLSVRFTEPRVLHDRLILGDVGNAWILTQSFKDFAARSPATIQKVDAELARDKFLAYSAIWDTARDPLS